MASTQTQTHTIVTMAAVCSVDILSSVFVGIRSKYGYEFTWGASVDGFSYKCQVQVWTEVVL